MKRQNLTTFLFKKAIHHYEMMLITQPLDAMSTLSNIPPNMKFVDKRPNSVYVGEFTEKDEAVKRFLD